ncbi:hypothetical protein ONZ45_g5080 [Pleurotus djamor]|nr:hypothetical protein ONZ45_g5080 [Pleurotus djamor]
MGRRKIEIQPITHERNRSVTFLKRKNGLFKKAYELGVLCSVDVAVIIFEERPGHHLKLYQYGSTDIHDIVQRHYDGEKDTRGPHDFSGNAASKMDDGDGDEDDGDDDDEPRSGGGGGLSSKRRGDGKLKSDTPNAASSSATGASSSGAYGKSSGLDLGLDVDYGGLGHRHLSIPPPPMSLHPSHHMSTSSMASHQHQGLPISNDRHGPRMPNNAQSIHSPLHHHQQNKKPRLMSNVNVNVGGISHSRSSSDDPISGGGGGHYGPSPTSYHPQSQRSHHPHHPNSFFNPTPPPTSFGGPPTNSFDYPSTSSSRSPTSANPSSAFSSSRYDSRGGGGGGGSRGGGGGMSSAFMDSDDRGSARSGPGGRRGVQLPVDGVARALPVRRPGTPLLLFGRRTQLVAAE